MAKRDKDSIIIGSCKVYMMDATNTMPDKETLCVEANRVGYVKSGCSVEYTEETHEEKDDLGYVSKVVTISEEALVKLGLITWNGQTLQKLIDRCTVTEDKTKGLRIVKIGGAGNAQGKYYVIGLHHEDKADGDIWVLLKGRNTAGATLAFAMDEGSLVEPEFRAMPHDAAGTLLEYIEQIPVGT